MLTMIVEHYDGPQSKVNNTINLQCDTMSYISRIDSKNSMQYF